MITAIPDGRKFGCKDLQHHDLITQLKYSNSITAKQPLNTEIDALLSPISLQCTSIVSSLNNNSPTVTIWID